MAAQPDDPKHESESAAGSRAGSARPADRPPFPVVAVGGSAGSLRAFQELLAHLPPDAPLAVVVVSHQDPEQPSFLPEILADACGLPVALARPGQKIAAGTVSVAPPGRYLGIRGGVFQRGDAIARGHPPLPVDAFMRELAEDCGPTAIGIVMSGTGSDGTLGLGAIQAAAGLTLAQDPETAEFRGMPQSAIAAGVVDKALAPADIAQRLVAHAAQLGAHAEPLRQVPHPSGEVERIVQLVAERTRQDFSAYKRGTLRRRIERRVHLHGLRGLGEYLRLVEAQPDELDALRRDWLIGVSAFFRDPQAFDALKAALLDLLRERPPGGELRAWVAGCATGQEAYSVAIVLTEAIEELGTAIEPRIFATDLDEAAVEFARAGRYPEGIAAEVPADRLRRFFHIENRHFVVSKTLRDRIIFAPQNVLQDPPFTRLDLISCRNLLIYLQPEAQRRTLTLFHYSLNVEGLLFLGSSESTSGADELYTSLDTGYKIFRRNAVHPGRFVQPDWVHRRMDGTASSRASEVRSPDRDPDFAELLQRRVAERYGPPCVLVDERGRVEHILGRTGEFLEPAPGQPTRNLLDMAREGLRAPLAAALREISRGDPRSVERTARVRSNGGRRKVQLRLTKLVEPRLSRPLFMVSFEAAEKRPEAEMPTASAEAPSAERELQLEEELRSTRQDLQASIEELQAANEELASANEEVQSVNEELQSTNEELQTSKEEAQSLNEELQTVNAELRAKVQSLEQANDDLRNLMDSTDIAMVFVDERLCVKRFTPAAQALVPLIASDVGRPLRDIAIALDYPDLMHDAEEVMRSLAPCTKEVRSPRGAWYSVRIRPYRTARNVIEGLAMSFVDITPLRRSRLASEEARSFREDLVAVLHEPFLILDADHNVLRANRSFCRAFRMASHEIEGRPIYALGDGAWDLPALRELLEDRIRESAAVQDARLEQTFPGIGRRTLHLNALRVDRSLAESRGLVLLAVVDATPHPSHAEPESGA